MQFCWFRDDADHYDCLCPRSKVVTATVVLLTMGRYRCTHHEYSCINHLSVRMSVLGHKLCTCYGYIWAAS